MWRENVWYKCLCVPRVGKQRIKVNDKKREKERERKDDIGKLQSISEQQKDCRNTEIKIIK